MELHGKRIILASGSPRRKEILEGMDISFTIDTENTFREEYSPDTPHEQIPLLMSEGKSHGFHTSPRTPWSCAGDRFSANRPAGKMLSGC